MNCNHEETEKLTYQYSRCLTCGEVICNGNIEEEECSW